jgi:hypothetical protein
MQNILSFSVLYKNINNMIYRTIILPVVLYERETFSLTLREERRLCLLENREPKRDEVPGEWKTLHNDERNDLYSSPNIVHVIESRIVSWAGHVARIGERRAVYIFYGEA